MRTERFSFYVEPRAVLDAIQSCSPTGVIFATDPKGLPRDEKLALSISDGSVDLRALLGYRVMDYFPLDSYSEWLDNDANQHWRSKVEVGGLVLPVCWMVAKSGDYFLMSMQCAYSLDANAEAVAINKEIVRQMLAGTFKDTDPETGAKVAVARNLKDQWEMFKRGEIQYLPLSRLETEFQLR